MHSHTARYAPHGSLGRAAFGKLGEWWVHVFHKATLFGVAALFLILAAEFLLQGIGGVSVDLFIFLSFLSSVFLSFSHLSCYPKPFTLMISFQPCSLLSTELD
jgi:hypothetical protein